MAINELKNNYDIIWVMSGATGLPSPAGGVIAAMVFLVMVLFGIAQNKKR